MIVSHDSGFLDNVCTDIVSSFLIRTTVCRADVRQMHYEEKKLVYYHGNLSKFVERVPAAKSYYTLAATSIK